MKEVDILRKLASTARQEPVPRINVIPGVFAALQAREDDIRRPLAWIAGLASVAAIPAAIFGLLALETIMDPMVGVYWVMRWTM